MTENKNGLCLQMVYVPSMLPQLAETTCSLQSGATVCSCGLFLSRDRQLNIFVSCKHCSILQASAVTESQLKSVVELSMHFSVLLE